MRTLRQCLLDTDVALLRVIAARWSIDIAGLKPRELIAQLESTIGDPARSSVMLDQLTPAERDGLRVLLAAGGTLPAPRFSQRFGAIRSIGPARLEREQPWRTPASPAEGLWYLGLIYKGFEQLPNGDMRDVFIAPAELQPVLSLLASAPTDRPPLPLTTAPETIRSYGAALADDACTLLSHLHNHFVRAADRTLLTVLTPQLRSADPVRWLFLRRVLEQARLIKLAGQRLRPDPRVSADWLRAPTLDQLRALFEAWRGDAHWSDLKQVREVEIERAALINADPVAVRAVVLDALHAAVPGAWHTCDALIDRIKTQSPDFLRADFDQDYIRDKTSGDYLRGAAAWERVEGALIRSILGGPLLWLGVLDTAGGEAPIAFSLTAIGAALLGRETDRAAARPIEHFSIHADATVRVGADRRYDRFQLARVADPIGLDTDTYHYRLTPSSLTRAASQKIDAAQVIDFLSRAAEQRVPPSLIKAIERWARKGAEVQVEQAVIVRVKDAAILKRLQESPKTRGFPLEVLGPTAARIHARDWPRLVAVLAEAGVLVDPRGEAE